MTNASALALSRSPSQGRAGLRRTVLADVVLPLVTVVTLLHSGAAPLAAYAVGSLFPLASIVISWAERRSLDYIGIGILSGIASALAMAVATGDPRFALMRAAPGLAVFGAACLGSLATKRPLMFFVARGLATGGDRERVAAWNARLSLPTFGKVMRQVTAVWGAGAVVCAALNSAAAFLLPASVAIMLEPAMVAATLTALLTWTRAIQRRNPTPIL
jgi:hypothetical protein